MCLCGFPLLYVADCPVYPIKSKKLQLMERPDSNEADGRFQAVIIVIEVAVVVVVAICVSMWPAKIETAEMIRETVAYATRSINI